MARLCEMTISSHFAKDREERCKRINEVLDGDWGEIICKVEDTEKRSKIAITDNGLYVVMDTQEKFLITCYLAKYSKAQALFEKAGEMMPKNLRKKIGENVKRYRNLYAEVM